MYRIFNYILVMSAFVLLSVNATAQIKADMAGALESGKADEIANYFTPQVDLTLLDQDDLFSKQEATALLKQFFLVHKPTGFNEIHSGENGSGLSYIIGKLTTNTGTYRVSYYYEGSSGNERIQQLIIDSE